MGRNEDEASTLKNPAAVIEVGAQARRYLRKTVGEGILMRNGTHMNLEVFSDSSYGPGGFESQGTVVVMWGSCPIMWKAGRQGTPSLSTAESELGEAVEGVIMGDAADCMVQEIHGGGYGKVVRIDNQAAVHLMREPAGGWRTRHLRLRAAHMRWRLGRADWLVEAIPGSEQAADIGTKFMTAPKLLEMRRMLAIEDLSTGQMDEKSRGDDDMQRPSGAEDENRGQALLKAKKMIQIAVLIEGVTGVRGEGLREEKNSEVDWVFILILFFAGIGVLSVLHGMWSLGEAWCWHRKKKALELREEKLGSPVRGDHEPGSRSPGAVDARRDLTRGGPEEDPVVTEMPEINQRASEASRRNTMRGETVTALEGETQQSQRRRVIITPWGEKYHLTAECPTLNLTKEIKFSPWCLACAADGTGHGLIISVGAGKTAHLRSDCPRRSRSAVGYRPCQVCIQREAA